LYEPRELADIMEKSGFTVRRVDHRDRWRMSDMVVVTGEREVTKPVLRHGDHNRVAL
jgi:hypothetical protein